MFTCHYVKETTHVLLDQKSATTPLRSSHVAAAPLCVVFSLLAALAVRLGHVSGIPAYLLAILPALPILGAILATGIYLDEEKDEFQRNLLVQSLLGGIGATLATTNIWGNLESFARAPHLDLIWIYPLFWIFVLVSYPIIWLRYK